MKYEGHLKIGLSAYPRLSDNLLLVLSNIYNTEEGVKKKANYPHLVDKGGGSPRIWISNGVGGGGGGGGVF